MAIRNNHWYNMNGQRYYPLDDKASAISDQGDLLPSALIVDLRLRWPLDFGQYAFIGAVTITPHLVTVMIEASDTMDNSTGSTLLAGVTLPRADLVLTQAYPLQAFQSGTGGFIAIGQADLAPYSGRFSTPQQSLLTPRAARPSRRPPFRSLGIEDAAVPLTGLVNLVAVPPLKMVKETRTIRGAELDNVIVFSLAQDAMDVLNRAATAERVQETDSVFAKFAGPCGKRVGSLTCGDPQPIQFINGVQPDCSGHITLEFRGCAIVAPNEFDCGVVIDCDLGLAQSCAPPYLPDLVTGLLPNEPPSNIYVPPSAPVIQVEDTYSVSESMFTAVDLPYCDDFFSYGLAGTPNGFFQPDNSIWEMRYDSSCPLTSVCSGHLGPHYDHNGYCWGPPSITTGKTNISLWGMDVQSLYRTYSTDVKLRPGHWGGDSPGWSHNRGNAGIVVNFFANDFSDLHQTGYRLYTYVLARIDVATSTFGIYFFNGMSLVTLVEQEVPDIRTDEWYRISIWLQPSMAVHQNIYIVADLEGLSDETAMSWRLTTTLPAENWRGDSGLAGLYAKQCNSYFAIWRVEEHYEPGAGGQ